MSSPNLGITHVAAAQNQKEVTLNDAIDALDRALSGKLLMLAQEGRQLQRLEVVGEQEFGSIAAHACSSSRPSRRI